MDAGTRTHVDDMIGAFDRLFVVLNHQDRIAKVAQTLQGFQKPGIVSLMKPDRGLVQNIEDTGQARPNLRCQADPLAFTTRQGTGIA